MIVLIIDFGTLFSVLISRVEYPLMYRDKIIVILRSKYSRLTGLPIIALYKINKWIGKKWWLKNIDVAV